jgi:hypothetical protein
VLTEAIVQAARPPQIVLEVGTWLGGGSTLHILQALETNGCGHLWGIEADRAIYEKMIANIASAVPQAQGRFTPLFGLSQDVIPQWLESLGPAPQVDFAFLDGGDQPAEQVTEFALLDPHMPVGSQLMAHDAKMRKGKWFVPFLGRLDHWRSQVHDSSEVGLLTAEKIALEPSPASRAAAQATLRSLRHQPIEIVARLLPGSLKGHVLRLLPRFIFRRLMRGAV